MLIGLLVACSGPVGAQATQVNVDEPVMIMALNQVPASTVGSNALLPDNLTAYIASLDTDYKPLKKKDLGPLVVKWGIKKAETQIIADFDGDNRHDHALIMQTSLERVSVIVFLNRASGYTHHVLRSFEYTKASGINVVMALMKKKIETYDEKGQVFWRPAIYVGLAEEHYFEAWFWNGYEFEYYKNGH